MWQEALKVAVVGFSVVFAALFVLAVSVRLMRFFFRHDEKRTEGARQ